MVLAGKATSFLLEKKIMYTVYNKTIKYISCSMYVLQHYYNMPEFTIIMQLYAYDPKKYEKSVFGQNKM